MPTIILFVQSGHSINKNRIMKKLNLFFWLVFPLWLTAQQPGETVSRIQVLESIGDTAFYLVDTIQKLNERGELDVSTNRILLGDSTTTDTKIGDRVFPDLNDISKALTFALQFRATLAKAAELLPLFQQLTGLTGFQYTGRKFGASLRGTWRVYLEDGSSFAATVVRMPNNSMRLVRDSDSAFWVVQMYVPNLFQIQNFDHDNNGATPGENLLVNYFRMVGNENPRRLFLPVSDIEGRTTSVAFLQLTSISDQ